MREKKIPFKGEGDMRKSKRWRENIKGRRRDGKGRTRSKGSQRGEVIGRGRGEKKWKEDRRGKGREESVGRTGEGKRRGSGGGRAKGEGGERRGDESGTAWEGEGWKNRGRGEEE